MKKKLLVLTSTYPRHSQDTVPSFVMQLNQQLSDTFDVHVLAPHAHTLPHSEVQEKVHVHRFQYFFSRWQTLTYGGGMLENLKRSKMNWFLLPLFFVAQTIAIWRLMRKYSFSIVHCHWIIPQGLSLSIAIKATAHPPPIMITSHGGDLYGLKGWFWRFIKKRILISIDHVTVVSCAMMDELQAYGIPLSRASVIPMGVNVKDEFIPLNTVPRNFNRVIFVGRLAEKKGVIYLVQAFKKVKEDHPEVELLIIGDGPERARIQRFIEQNALTNDVQLLGGKPKSALPELFSSSSIAVMPSIVAKSGDQEGLGLVSVEAMGCGCIPIISRLPATRDLLFDDIIEWSVPPEDVDGLAANISRAIKTGVKHDKLRHQVRDFAQSKFDWTSIGKRYTQTLLRVEKNKNNTKNA